MDNNTKNHIKDIIMYLNTKYSVNISFGEDF